MSGHIYGKIIISAKISLDSGLHIGGTESGLEVGGIDSPVIRDPVSQEPYIPGSSIKGKLRSLLEKVLEKDFNRLSGKEVYRHECTDQSCEVCRLFGATSGQDDGENMPSRVYLRDARLTKQSLEDLKLIETGLLYTEWKTENSLDRVTSAASPRQLERVPAGSVFELSLVYTITDQEDVKKDLKNLMATFKLLEDDALGGGGSRGNGSISFSMEEFVHYPKNYYLNSDDQSVKKIDLGKSSAKETNTIHFIDELFS